MAYCTHCGNALPEGVYFCTVCGASVQNASASALPVSEDAAPSAAGYGVTFRNSGIGLVLTGILLIAVLIMGFTSPMFTHINNLETLLGLFVTSAAVGFSVVLSMRAKGPDLSVGLLMGLSATIIASIGLSSGSIWIGLPVALVVCAIFGLINGVFSVYFRVPAVIITIITGALAYSLSLLISKGDTITGDFPTLEDLSGFTPVLLLGMFAIAFLLVLFTPLGKPAHLRENSARPVSYMLAYIASAVIASIAGLYSLLHMQIVTPSIGTNYQIDVLFIFAVVYSSRVLDNRFAPVLFSLVPAFILCLLTDVLFLKSFDFYIRYLVYGALTLLFGIIAYVCRREKQSEMLELLSR